jgi:hypothetical protein
MSSKPASYNTLNAKNIYIPILRRLELPPIAAAAAAVFRTPTLSLRGSHLHTVSTTTNDQLPLLSAS